MITKRIRCSYYEPGRNPQGMERPWLKRSIAIDAHLPELTEAEERDVVHAATLGLPKGRPIEVLHVRGHFLVPAPITDTVLFGGEQRFSAEPRDTTLRSHATHALVLSVVQRQLQDLVWIDAELYRRIPESGHVLAIASEGYPFGDRRRIGFSACAELAARLPPGMPAGAPGVLGVAMRYQLHRPDLFAYDHRRDSSPDADDVRAYLESLGLAPDAGEVRAPWPAPAPLTEQFSCEVVRWSRLHPDDEPSAPAGYRQMLAERQTREAAAAVLETGVCDTSDFSL